MSEASFASLGPTLLARKGGAKPAMRPQWGELPKTMGEGAAEDQLEDLGWNDMGADDDAPIAAAANTAANTAAAATGQSAEVVSINVSAPKSKAHIAQNDAEEHLIQAKSPKKNSAAKAQKLKKKSAKAASMRRAAFTLRLDADRHLKLRLAATMQGVSAQALVTEALDTMLAEIEDLDSIASRMKRH